MEEMDKNIYYIVTNDQNSHFAGIFTSYKKALKFCKCASYNFAIDNEDEDSSLEELFDSYMEDQCVIKRVRLNSIDITKPVYIMQDGNYFIRPEIKNEFDPNKYLTNNLEKIKDFSKKYNKEYDKSFYIVKINPKY